MQVSLSAVRLPGGRWLLVVEDVTGLPVSVRQRVRRRHAVQQKIAIGLTQSREVQGHSSSLPATLQRRRGRAETRRGIDRALPTSL